MATNVIPNQSNIFPGLQAIKQTLCSSQASRQDSLPTLEIDSTEDSLPNLESDCKSDETNDSKIGDCSPDNDNSTTEAKTECKDKLLLVEPYPNAIVNKRSGSVRGLRNGVKHVVTTYAHRIGRRNKYDEVGKIVIFITSLTAVRKTWNACKWAMSILENHSVDFERRDVHISSRFLLELQERMACSSNSTTDLPQIFIDGEYFGDVDRLSEQNENGQLKIILEPFKSGSRKMLCKFCHGFQFRPCQNCHGGKKSTVIDLAPFEAGHCNQQPMLRLKCARCDINGLEPCDQCETGFVALDHL